MNLPHAFETYRRGVAATERFGDTAVFEWLQHWATIPPAYIDGDWERVLDICNDELARRPQHYLLASAHELRARIRLARGDLTGAVLDARRSLALARAASDPQALLPGLSALAFALVAAGVADEGSAVADELLAHDKLDSATPHFASPWFDLSWALVDLGRVRDLAAAVTSCAVETRWLDAAGATADGDFVRAAAVYADAGNVPAEAYTRLRAARAGLPDAGLENAIGFFRKAGATAYLAEAEDLATGSREEPARARSTRRAP